MKHTYFSRKSQKLQCRISASNVVSVKGVSLRFCSLFWRELNVDGRVTRLLFGGKITKCCYWHYWWHQKSLAAATAFVKCISETRGKNLDEKKTVPCIYNSLSRHCNFSDIWLFVRIEFQNWKICIKYVGRRGKKWSTDFHDLFVRNTHFAVHH